MRYRTRRPLVVALGVLAMLVACDSGTEPTPGAPIIMKALVDTVLSGDAAAPVSPRPKVRVLDGNGAPASGVTVRFEITQGGGIVNGGEQVTDAGGEATVGEWRLGTLAGANVLAARVGDRFALRFRATTTANAPPMLQKVSGDEQSAAAGTAVRYPPVVKVVDAHGNPVQGVTVTFAANSGGSVEGSTVVTDAAGRAAVGKWTLGPAPRENVPNSLTASLGSASTTFTATALSRCAIATPLTPGETVSGAFDDYDCKSVYPDGNVYFHTDLYSVNLPAASAYQVDLVGGLKAEGWRLYTWLSLHDRAGRPVAYAWPSYYQGLPDGATRINIVAPAGRYFPVASTFDPYDQGSYDITARTLPSADLAYCEPWWVMMADQEVQTTQALTGTDCVAGEGAETMYYDHFAYLPRQGDTITVTMVSKDFVPRLSTQQEVAESFADDTSAVMRVIGRDWWNDMYHFSVGSAEFDQLGGYTLKIRVRTAKSTAPLAASSTSSAGARLWTAPASLLETQGALRRQAATARTRAPARRGNSATPRR